MSDERPDYARFGRQIALPELGASGQRRLAETPVRFEPASALAREAHERAGGVVADDSSVVVELPATVARGVAAWASVEAARRVMGQPSRGMPDGLLARLGV